MGEDIQGDMDTFEKFRAYVAREFRIDGMEAVARPAWEYTLFRQDDGGH